MQVFAADKQLELVMQSVLEGMNELALEYGYRPQDGDFQILSIESPTSTPLTEDASPAPCPALRLVG